MYGTAKELRSSSITVSQTSDVGETANGIVAAEASEREKKTEDLKRLRLEREPPP